MRLSQEEDELMVYCCAIYGGFVCTKDRGHVGAHRGRNVRGVVFHWEPEPIQMQRSSTEPITLRHHYTTEDLDGAIAARAFAGWCQGEVDRR